MWNNLASYSLSEFGTDEVGAAVYFLDLYSEGTQFVSLPSY
jgi:hypothetical protein